jgi:hypothetical protein
MSQEDEERLDEAQDSADAIATMAEFISNALDLNYSPKKLKEILEVPLKQIEEELAMLKAYVNELK